MNAPESGTMLHVIYVRNDNARQVIAGFASAMPIASEMWQQVDRALADELRLARMDRANLLAAMRATLAAHADGEADPLYYLRDELNASEARPAGHGEAS